MRCLYDGVGHMAQAAAALGIRGAGVDVDESLRNCLGDWRSERVVAARSISQACSTWSQARCGVNGSGPVRGDAKRILGLVHL